MAQREYNKLFVGGDLSGIQKFLYNITSRHASVSLKGRSAFLSDYLRNVCDQIERTIKKHGGSIDELYCSGGKFYLITENTTAITEAIKECSKIIKKKLWEEHKGQLGINISEVAFAEEKGKFFMKGHEDEQNTKSGVLWKYVNADFARQKNQKFKDLLTTCPNKFFGFDGKDEDSKELIVGKEHKVCALTGVESPDCRPLTKKDFEKEGLTLAEFEEEEDTNNVSDNTPVYLPSVIKQIVEGKKLSIKYKTKSFEKYATTDIGIKKGIKGDTYLGVLRMDVDGMGKKFIIGFSTLDVYRDFSKRAKYFFEYYIGGKKYEKEDGIGKGYLLDEEDQQSGKKYRDFVNVIYAGGDDLFIVGRWDKVIDFAKLIHQKTIEEFKDDAYIDIFASEKPLRKISISGGIAIVKPKFPIAKAADMAGDAEDAAKQGEKNAFNLFGKNISWEKEFDFVEEFKNKFVNYVSNYNKDYGFSRSVLHKIMLYSEIADMNVEREAKGKPKNYSYMWHISYFMTRFMEKFKGFDREPNEQKRKIKKELYDFCCDLRNKQLIDNRHLELIAIAARWAELILKDKEKANNN